MKRAEKITWKGTFKIRTANGHEWTLMINDKSLSAVLTENTGMNNSENG